MSTITSSKPRDREEPLTILHNGLRFLIEKDFYAFDDRERESSVKILESKMAERL